MDKEAVIAAVLEQGRCLMVVEYLVTKVEKMAWRDKKTGRPMEGVVSRHSVLAGDETMGVSEFNAEGSTVEGVKAAGVPWKKGEKVVLRVEGIGRKDGNVSCRGRLEALASDPVPGVTAGNSRRGGLDSVLAGGLPAVKPDGVRR